MATNTASAENFGENHFFYEDEVLKFDKNGRVKFGLVLESYEANYSESESDFEDSVKKGELRVAWHPEGSVEVIEEQYVSGLQVVSFVGYVIFIVFFFYSIIFIVNMSKVHETV